MNVNSQKNDMRARMSNLGSSAGEFSNESGGEFLARNLLECNGLEVRKCLNVYWNKKLLIGESITFTFSFMLR